MFVKRNVAMSYFRYICMCTNENSHCTTYQSYKIILSREVFHQLFQLVRNYTLPSNYQFIALDTCVSIQYFHREHL